jgi:hypothetical protein
VLPLVGSASYQHLYEGRRRAYGMSLHADLGATVQGQRHASMGQAYLRLPRAQLFGRHYFTASVATPWYAELATGVQGASYQLGWAGQASRQNALYTPLRIEAAVGRGRIIPISPRLRLQKLSRMLKQQGALKRDIPPEVAREIMRVWWALRQERGYAQRLARTLEVLAQTGLLEGEANQLAVYAFGQIFNDTALAPRWEGSNTRLAVRYGATWGETDLPMGLQPARSTVVLQAGHRHIINLGYDTAWTFEGMVSFAPRRIDRLDTVLPLAWPGAPPALEQARVALAVPVTYQHYHYDPAYNVRGLLALRARLGAAYDVPSTQRARAGYVNAMAGLGIEATWYQGRAMGLSAGADIDMGHAYGRLGFVAGAYLRAQYGHFEALRIGPGAISEMQLGDITPNT